jgi:hypothetical protein
MACAAGSRQSIVLVIPAAIMWKPGVVSSSAGMISAFWSAP